MLHNIIIRNILLQKRKYLKNGTISELLTLTVMFYKLFYTQKIYQYSPKGSFAYGTRGWQKLQFLRFLFLFAAVYLGATLLNILSYFSYDSVRFQKRLYKSPAIFIIHQAFSRTTPWPARVVVIEINTDTRRHPYITFLPQ